MDINAIKEAIGLMIFGMTGIFLVLILLFAVSKVLLKLFPQRN